MHLIRHWQTMQPLSEKSVFTIGNFDGVHLGHVDILKQLSEYATSENCSSGLLVFEPQPLEFFRGSDAPARLMTFREKFNYLATFNLDWLGCIRFNAAFAALSAETFVKEILVKRFRVKRLVIGEDFRFGCKREGDVTMLKRMAKTLGFEVVVQAEVRHAAERISSSQIRQALAQGAFAESDAKLGRPFSFTGRVVHGSEKARTIGVPTANILMKRRVLPLRGVFCVEVLWRGQRYPAIANIGTRPTVGGIRALLEVHLLTTSADLYGESLTVTCLKKLRDEQRFDTFAALTEQIHQDVAAAKAFWQID